MVTSFRYDSEYWEKIHYLVFSGGAMNGLAYVGVLRVLEAVYNNMYENIKGYAGTSIGALVSLLLCLGYTSRSMQTVIEGFDVSSMLSSCTSIFTNFGIVDTKSTIGVWIADLVNAYMGHQHVTFAELYRRTRQELTVVVCNITHGVHGKLEYWNRKTQPHMRVCDAVMCSMAFPLLFTPVSLQGSIYIDGGLGDNFPTTVYPEDRTLGVCINLPTKIPSANFIDYAMTLLELKRVFDSGIPKKPNIYSPRIMYIDCNCDTAFNFFAKNNQRRKLVGKGMLSTIFWLLYVPMLIHTFILLYDLNSIINKTQSME